MWPEASPSKGARARTAAQPPSAEQRAASTTIALEDADTASVATIMAKLPDPTTLPAGTLVIVPGEIAKPDQSLARSVLAVFGRAKTVERAHRCTALVARGYVDVGATDTPRDLTWGYAPRPHLPKAPASVDDVTEPC